MYKRYILLLAATLSDNFYGMEIKDQQKNKSLFKETEPPCYQNSRIVSVHIPSSCGTCIDEYFPYNCEKKQRPDLMVNVGETYSLPCKNSNFITTLYNHFYILNPLSEKYTLIEKNFEWDRKTCFKQCGIADSLNIIIYFFLNIKRNGWLKLTCLDEDILKDSSVVNDYLNKNNLPLYNKSYILDTCDKNTHALSLQARDLCNFFQVLLREEQLESEEATVEKKEIPSIDLLQKTPRDVLLKEKQDKDKKFAALYQKLDENKKNILLKINPDNWMMYLNCNTN